MSLTISPGEVQTLATAAALETLRQEVQRLLQTDAASVGAGVVRVEFTTRPGVGVNSWREGVFTSKRELAQASQSAVVTLARQLPPGHMISLVYRTVSSTGTLDWFDITPPPDAPAPAAPVVEGGMPFMPDPKTQRGAYGKQDASFLLKLDKELKAAAEKAAKQAKQSVAMWWRNAGRRALGWPEE